MKYFIAIIIFSVSLLQLHAQKMEQDHERFFRAGLIAGLNINSLDGKSFSKEYNFNYQLGGFLLFNPLTKIGFQPEVHFAQNSATYSNDQTDIYDNLFGGGDQSNVKYNVLKVNGLVNIDIGPSQRVKLQLGPQYGIVIQQSTGVQTAARDVFKKGDFSALGGLWLQLPFVFIGGRYEHGFTNLNNIDNRDTWRSRSFQIIAGVTF
jgi:Outer membrane protein beta-barrel domain